MSQSRPTVAVLPSSAMAEVVRKQLETAGIETSTVETDGDFQLQVAEADFPRAMQLLFPMPGSTPGAASGDASAAPWKCPHCGEEVQPVSDVCWACGKPRAGAAAPSSAGPLEERAAPPGESETLRSGERETLRSGEPEASASERSSAAAAANDPEANASGSPANASGAPVHAATELRPAKRPARPSAFDEPSPWREPWLIALWTLIAISIGVIAWLALR